MKLRLAALIVLLVSTCVIAGDYDTAKLAEGSIWTGTYKITNKKGIVFSSGIQIKILKRDKTNFVGEWSQSANDVSFEIKGSVSSNRLSFKFTRELKGDPSTGAVGGRSAAGTIVTRDGKEVITGTTVTEGKPNLAGEWEAELKKD